MNKNQFQIQDAFQVPGKAPVIIEFDSELTYPTEILRYIAKIEDKEYPFTLTHNERWIAMQYHDDLGDIRKLIGKTIELF